MSEINYKRANKDDIEDLMKVRLEMLRKVNDLPDDYEYDEVIVNESKKYFETGDQTTILAYDGQKVVGCPVYHIFGLCRLFHILQVKERI